MTSAKLHYHETSKFHALLQTKIKAVFTPSNTKYYDKILQTKLDMKWVHCSLFQNQNCMKDKTLLPLG